MGKDSSGPTECTLGIQFSSLFEIEGLYRVYNYMCGDHFSIHMVIVLNCNSPPGCLRFMMHFVGGV